VEESYLRIGVEAVSPEDVRAILQTLTDKAKGGDLRAAELVLRFLFGADAVVTRQLAADLETELEKFRHERNAEGNGAAARGGGPEAAAEPHPGESGQ
jgi:hypothetical protein